MGAFLSIPPPVAIYLAVRAGRGDEVKAIVKQAYNGIPLPGCLEWQDELGDTALSIAARNGDYDLVNLLLDLGSDSGHISDQPGGATPLHEAVQNVKVRTSVLLNLLQRGANPFVENDYGITPWEIALSRRQSTICRRFEQEKHLFANHLQVEVNAEPREHRRRWITIIPKYSSNKEDTPITRHLYVFKTEQSPMYRQKINLANTKPPVVVRIQNGWKLFLGPIKKKQMTTNTDSTSLEKSNLVFIFGSDRSNRKLLENFLISLEPTRVLSLTPPPPKGKPIVPYRGLNTALTTGGSREHILTSSSLFAKSDFLAPKRLRRATRPPSPSEVSLQVNGPCVICLENPQTAGFAHGRSIHRCVCKKCALLLTKQKKQATCPVCRQEIQHIITDFF